MNRVRWVQIDEILLAALELDRAERASFVERACAGDESLREEVLSLLSGDERSLDLIDTPALESAACILAWDESSLAEGQYVGHYRILSLLGIGGMGEVYLAEDTKLGRKIALKLLPADFASDPARVRRFQQEARAASALNHPNIITIYETGELQDRHFIASEFIEGVTLRQLTSDADLDLAGALDIAIQVANALTAAHNAGIVHRDIKPENVMRRPDGYVKVLDFGLAKLTERQVLKPGTQPPRPDETNASHPGLVMGTVNYMSPEQARGLALDARSDIFSLGVLIYEMVTGHAPFPGATQSDVIARILKEDPPPLEGRYPNIPHELQLIVSKALSKDKDERYRSAEDMLVDLKALRRNLEIQGELGGADGVSVNGASQIRAAQEFGQMTRPFSGSQSDTPSPGTSLGAVIGEFKRHKSSAMFTVAGLVVVAAVISVVFRGALRAKQALPFQNVQMTRLTANGKSRDAAVSPDGKLVAYVLEEGKRQSIWIVQVATNNSVQLVPPGAVRLAALTFSPDSNSLFYVRYDEPGTQSNTLYAVSVLGGPSKKIISDVHCPISFSPDGSQFAFFRRVYAEGIINALLVANTDGTEERRLATHGGAEAFYDYPCGPAWSPDGKRVACGVHHLEIDLVDLAEVAIDTGAERIIASAHWKWFQGLAWLSDGSGLLIDALEGKRPPGTNQIWSVSYPGGEIRRITNDLAEYSGLSLTADSHTIALSLVRYADSIWIEEAGQRSEANPVTHGTGGYTDLSWAPDGRIIFSESAKAGFDMRIMNPDGTNQKVLMPDSGHCWTPTVSRDGKYVVFTFRPVRDEEGSIWRVDIDGENPKQLTQMPGDYPECSADGRWVIFKVESGLWRVPIDGGEAVQIVRGDVDSFDISPDGTSIAYVHSDSGLNGQSWIGIFAFGANSSVREPAKLRVPANAIRSRVKWSSDGNALLYVHSPDDPGPDFPVDNIWRHPLNGAPARQVTDFKSQQILSFDQSPDGRQLACARRLHTSDVVLLTINK